MSRHHTPRVSFVLATHNRRAVVTRTLERLDHCGLDRRDYEIVVVDNASDDGTPDGLGERVDLLIRLRRNAGSCAKAYGVERAGAEYIVFLDDDSYPHPGSVVRMIEHFERDAGLGAAGFTVHLPDGRMEGGALPDVFVGCGVGFRAEALRRAGGVDRSFFMQAEEYDLAFRLVGAGWRVRVFDDLHVEHLKTRHARKSARTTYYDVRNNLRVVARHLPSPYYEAYRKDWLQRYRWLARVDGQNGAWARGVWAGRWWATFERWRFAARRLNAEALEFFFCWNRIRRHMENLVSDGVRTIVLADLGKNIFAYHRAAKDTGVKVLAIGDDRFCAASREYRGIPIVSLDEALEREADAVVVANSSAVHGTYTCDQVVRRVQCPVYHWFFSSRHAVVAETGSHARETLPNDKNAMRETLAPDCPVPAGRSVPG